MDKGIYVQLRFKGSNDVAIFKSVAGLQPFDNAAQHLVFSEGKIFGNAFLKWLAGSAKVVRKEMELSLYDGDLQLSQWMLYNTSLNDYQLNELQTTEEYLAFKQIELTAQSIKYI
ncbi:hypothetical protein [Pedobacter sp. Leaf170]|uniref:hypothetical protein n=1 Tax=Pedobacter sp. Leaf170 TaxID=2876558 RepID=UPI001E487AC8|nr:hypothetical protein [Pedobacter sp. Leaf170]